MALVHFLLQEALPQVNFPLIAKLSADCPPNTACAGINE